MREKRGFPKGLKQKSGEFQGVMIKLAGNPGDRGSTLKKLISSIVGGGGLEYNFSGKAQLILMY